MKIFIIGESHSKSHPEKSKILYLKDVDNFIVGFEDFFAPLIKADAIGLEDLVIRLHSDIVGAYTILKDAPTHFDYADFLESIKQIKEMRAKIESSCPEYYHTIYYPGVLQDILSIVDELEKIVAQKSTALYDLEVILTRTSNIILKNSKTGFTDDASIDIHSITSYDKLLPFKKKSFRENFLYTIREKAFSYRIKEIVSAGMSQEKPMNAAIFTIGREHLDGLQKQLGDKFMGSEIIYCSTYQDFWRAYETHTTQLSKSAGKNLAGELVDLKIQKSQYAERLVNLENKEAALTDFFNSKVRSQRASRLQFGENKLVLDQQELDMLKQDYPQCITQ